MRRLLGKSARSMLWEAHDPSRNHLLTLALPRVQPAGDAALERWLEDARAASRLSHPRLAPVVEVGAYQGMPFMAHECAQGTTLAQRIDPRGQAFADVSRWALQALEGLAFAHDAGLAHRDLQLHMLYLDERGQLQILGLAAASQPKWSLDAGPQQARQAWIERDLLAVGLAMHHLLAGRPGLDLQDLGEAVARLAPHGDAMVQLPRELALPDGFRAVVDRCLDAQPRQRFRNARTMALALQEWVPSHHASGTDELPTQLLERVRRHGALPALPGSTAIMARLLGMERQHVGALARMALQDPAICLELLRQANSSFVRSTQQDRDGAVVTVRRSIALIGLSGVQQAAQLQRPWPGVLDEASSPALLAQMERALHAARLAQRLSPVSFDPEILYIVTLLQQLGGLLVHYHFPDLARQMRLLMSAPQADKPGEAATAAMDELQAARTVLGVELSDLAVALARQWGLDGVMQQLMRRFPLHQPISVHSDDDLLRAVASAACEAVDAYAQPAQRSIAAVAHVVKRYAKLLKLDVQTLRLLLLESAAAPSLE